MLILLVEDAIDLWETISDYLIECNFSLERAKTIRQANIFLEKTKFDCIVLDWMLPDGNGDEFCKAIKKKYAVPIIMSTAKSQIEDKLEWFEAGADDYITKPYDLRELEARIQALVRRGENNDSTKIIGNLFINLESMEITDQTNNKIHCTNSEWIVIKILAENLNRPVSRSDLIDYIRGGEWTRGFENKLDVLMSGLRKKLGKDTIETVKGFWYKFSVG